MTQLVNYLESLLRIIEQKLDHLIPVRHGIHQQLFEAARYAVLGGGKRLRPILTLATTEMFGGNIEEALTPACSLEFIHTYSMIHDDLPCMDDDDYRRGRLTVHRQYNEGLAVLAGDFLLTYAFDILANDPLLNADKKMKLISTLAHRSGSDGMIGGQVMDLACEGKSINLDTLRLLHRNKTAALLTASIEFGGIICDVSEPQLENLRRFGENLGLAFQIVDDILDVTSSQTKHGKDVSSDVLNQKSTYVTLLGLEQARQYAQECYHEAVTTLKALPFDTSLLAEIADFVLKRDH
jgi:geranylgeranyl pyrophosphate synthase